MWARIRGLLAPPVFEGDEEKTRTAALLHVMLLVVLAGGVLFPATLAILGQPIGSPVNAIVAALLVSTLALLVVLRLGYVQPVGVVLSLLLWVSFTIPMFSFGGMHDSAITGYFAVIILAGLVGGRWTLLAFSALCMLGVAGVFGAENSGLIEASVPLPSEPNDLVLVVVVLGMSAVLLHNVVGRIRAGSERARQNAQALEASNQQLAASRDALAAQGMEVARRARYLEATAAVAQQAAQELDLEQLQARVVKLIGEQFGFYHVGLFLLAPGGEWVFLQAASSEGGQRLLERGYRLRVGRESLVGEVAAWGERRVMQDAVKEGGRFARGRDLPETRSEVALPLRARGEILGVLDVQSREAEAFSEEEVTVLQTLADQVAVAIDNARLFRQAEESLEAERRAYGELSQAAWQALLRARPDLAFVSDEGGTRPAGDLWEPQMMAAVQRGEAVLAEPRGETAASVAIPIKLHGQVVGVIDSRKSDGAGGWTSEEMALLEMLAEQLNVALEGARLYGDTQRRAAQERLVAEVSARMRETLDVRSVLETAAEELYRELGLDRVVIHLAADQETAAGPEAAGLVEAGPRAVGSST